MENKNFSRKNDENLAADSIANQWENFSENDDEIIEDDPLQVYEDMCKMLAEEINSTPPDVLVTQFREQYDFDLNRFAKDFGFSSFENAYDEEYQFIRDQLVGWLMRAERNHDLIREDGERNRAE